MGSVIVPWLARSVGSVFVLLSLTTIRLGPRLMYLPSSQALLISRPLGIGLASAGAGAGEGTGAGSRAGGGDTGSLALKLPASVTSRGLRAATRLRPDRSRRR
jgi:hypothetical protein